MEKTSKKWFLKNIFRKNNNNNKKEIPSADFSSDEEDAKAGFYSADFYLRKFSPKKKHHDMSNNSNFHQIYNPKANSEFCYFEAAPPQASRQNQEVIYQPSQNDNVYHNFVTARNTHHQQQQQQPRHYSLSPRCFSNTELSIDYGSQASSQDEKLSCNSFNTPHMVNVNNEINARSLAVENPTNSKKSRTARNQRYYQRLLRDEGRPSTIYGCVYDEYNDHLKSNNEQSSADKLPNSLSNQSISRLPGPRYRGATLSDLDDYENILKVDENIPPPIPPRDPNRRFSMHSSITKNPYYFDHSLQKYVVINKNNPQQQRNGQKQFETLEKPLKFDAHSTSAKNDQHLRSNSANDLALRSHPQQPKTYQRFNKHHRNLTITEGVKFPFSSHHSIGNSNNHHIGGVDESDFVGVGTASVQDLHHRHVHQTMMPMPHKKFSSFEDINRYHHRGVDSSPHVNQTLVADNRKMIGNNNSSEKKSNLDDAINELEKMYKRLMSDESLLDLSDHRPLPTLDDYATMMKKYEEYEQEENRTDREPDLVKDDVFSRNLKHANKMYKNIDQLPFGIPNQTINPIPPKPPRDYLSVNKPEKVKSAIVVSHAKPDLITDDLAVRNLRRDTMTLGTKQRTNSTSEMFNNSSPASSQPISILSPVTQKIHIGILSGAKNPSGIGRNATKGGDSDAENKEMEESLNALIIESKAISEKLEEDLSKMKQKSLKTAKSINRISSVDLLDFENKQKKKYQNLPQNVVEKEQKISLRSPPTQPTPVVRLNKSNVEKVKMDVQMVSTACSPIRELQTVPVDIPTTTTPTTPKAKPRASSVEKKAQASPKISDLIQMFSKESSTTPIKPKKSTITTRSKSIETIGVKSSPEQCEKSPSKSSSQNEFETNIENIRDLIKQMKKTEFDLATPTKQFEQDKKHENDSREASTDDFDQATTTTTGTESVITTTSSVMTLESNNESLPKIKDKSSDEDAAKAATTSAIEIDAMMTMITKVDDNNNNEEKDDEEENNENDDYYDNIKINNDDDDDRDNEDEIKIVLTDESCSQNFINNQENINEAPADDDDETKMSLEEKVKKQLENISLNLEKFKDETMMTTTAIKACSNDANNNNNVLDAESLYNSTEELSMIFANAENYVSQGNEDDDEIDVLDADFVAASEKEFEKLVLDCNNNNSSSNETFDNQMKNLTNGDFALGMCPLSSVEAQSQITKKSTTANDGGNDACSTQSKKEAIKAATKDDENNAQQQKKAKPSTSTSTTSTITPLSTLQEQAFVLACVYFIILVTQLLTFK